MNGFGDAPTECENCGRVPAGSFKFEQCTGMLLSTRISTVNATLCKECALRVGREMQSSTLLTGWWGLLSFVRNIGVVLSNASGLSRANKMKMADGGELSFLRNESVFRRPKSWVGVGVIALVAVVIGSAIATSEDSSPTNNQRSNVYVPSNNNSPAPAQSDWAVGSCVSGGYSLTPVPCSQIHSGRIVRAATTPSGCPASTESYVDHAGGVLCIDEDQ